MTLLQRHPGAALAGLAVIVFVLAAASALRTTFPIVLSDEANYLLPTLHGYSAANFERWSILSAIPNYLYYAIYRTLAGPELYPHAKVLNAAFLAASVYPIYGVARTRLPTGAALLLAALGAVAPVTTYVRYFMPEALYNLGFWTATFVVLRTLPRSAPLAGLVAGGAFGALSLVKPHALALAVGMAAFLLLRGGDWRKRGGAVLLVVAAYWVARTLVAITFTGRIDTTLAGPGYASALLGGFAAWPAARNAIGHLAALLLLVGVPLWVVARHVGHALARRTRVDDLALLALCMLVALVAMTVVFSASVYAIAPAGERITRLHGRYYAFALPLLVIAFTAVSREAPAWQPGRRAVVTLCAVVLVAAFGVALGYETGFVDYPDLSLLTRWPQAPWIAGLAAGCCILAARRARSPGAAAHAVPIVWWGTVALATSFTLLAAPFAGKAFKPNAVDHALATPALRALVGRDDVMVVGTQHEATEPYRVMFGLASLARGRIVAAGTTIAPEQVPADVRVLILLPRVAFGGAADTAQVGPLTLVTLP